MGRCISFIIGSLLLASSAFAQGTTTIRDGNGDGVADVLNATPSGTEYGIVVRPIGGGAGGGDGAILDGVSASIKATVFDFTNSNPLGVVLRDTNGDYVSVGGGTQYNQGTATTDTDILTMAGCVRADTAAVATGVADQDRTRCIVDSTGRLWAHVGTIDGGTITSITNPVAVTGTFWQATQPVSGTFWQATQPVSGTVTVTDGAGALNVIVDSGSLTANAGTNLNTSLLFLDSTYTGRMPAGASPAENESNTNTALSRIGAFNYVFDGAAWDRWTGAVTGSGNFTVVQGTGTNLHMVCDSGCTPGGSFADNTAFTFGTSAINNMGAVVDDTSTNTVTENSAGAPRMNTNRILYTMPTNSTGTALALALDASVDGLEGGIGAAADAAATVGSTGSLSAKERLMTTQLDAIQTAVQTIDNIVSGAGANITQFGGTNVVTGTGTGGAGIPRVTVSNDSVVAITGSVTVTDGAGPLNVIIDSGTVTAVTAITNALPTGANTIGAVTGTAGDNSANSSLKVPVLNSRANAAAPAWTEGNQVPLSVDLAGNLRVNSTGGGAADGTTFTENSSTFSATGGVYNEAMGGIVSGKEYASRITSQRGLHSNLRNEYGIELGTATNPIMVAMAPYQMANQIGKFPLAVNTDRLVAGPFNTPIGVRGDRLKVDPTPNADACATQQKTDVAISQTASTKIVSGVPGQSIYICLIRVVAGVAEITSEWEGTGAACATGKIVHSGSATAANGESFAANGGYSTGAGTASVISLSPGNDFCLGQSGANRVSGKVSYVYGP
jgi:hypothetical protein